MRTRLHSGLCVAARSRQGGRLFLRFGGCATACVRGSVQFAIGQLDAELAAQVDATDIIQEAFLAAVRAFPQFRGQTIEEWDAWLVKIVRRKVQDARRYWQQPRRSLKRQATNLENDRREPARPRKHAKCSCSSGPSRARWIMNLVPRPAARRTGSHSPETHRRQDAG